jgi:hypothetical protein
VPDLLGHAVQISYRFPLPIWIYVLAGGLAVLASAPAAVLAVGVDASTRRSRPFRVPGLGRAGLVVSTVLFLYALIAGLASPTAQSHLFFENPMTVLVWVDFWVGLGIVCGLVGNIWDSVSPLSAAARVLDRALARRQAPQLAYPARLGQWPAVVLVLGWSWAELIWSGAKDPRTLAMMAIAYCLLTLAGAALFGAETWLGNAELFTVVARTFGRFAPLEIHDGSARLRPYGAGLLEEPLPAGGGPLVVTLLATVVYDGFSQTTRFFRLETWIFDRASWLRHPVHLLDTLLMLAIVVLFVLAYLLVAGSRRTANLYAPTLIPIAVVYFAAHYFSYLLLAGQQTVGAIVDPFGHDWNPWGLGEYPIHRGVTPAALVWWSQIALIVAGHVEAVFAAHRVALREGIAARRALLLQMPLVLLMVAYTMAGLWVLAQQIKA